MACAYLLVSLSYRGEHQQVPGVFMMIVQSAFGVPFGFGALAAQPTQGVMRGVFANRGGAETSAIAAAELCRCIAPGKNRLASCLSVPLAFSSCLPPRLLWSCDGLLQCGPARPKRPPVWGIPGKGIRRRLCAWTLTPSFRLEHLLSLSPSCFLLFIALLTYYYSNPCQKKATKCVFLKPKSYGMKQLKPFMCSGVSLSWHGGVSGLICRQCL